MSYPTELPAPLKITELKNGFRFVCNAKGVMIPNQGHNDYDSDEDIVENYWVWAERNNEATVKFYLNQGR